MGSEDKRVVWILGAGFSRSLGGPLLTALLSAESEQNVAVRFASARPLLSETARIVRRLYLYGTRLPAPVQHWMPELRPRESLWDHAEDFLDYLDTAAVAQDGPRATLLLRIAERIRLELGIGAKPTIGELAADGRRLIAAECCAFLSDADTSSEKWKPYKTWASSLGKNDTVLTFNYDRVLELLKANNLAIEHPGGFDKDSTCARVFKLHGSVDWKRETVDRRVRFTKTNDPTFALCCADGELAIATPGPSKQTTVEQLDPHWPEALAALAAADALVFVGFRFPPSDADARTRFLEAITANQAMHLDLHVVLGPSSPDAERLVHLLEFACVRGGRKGPLPFPEKKLLRNRSTTVHPLFAEDFFTVYERRMLFGS